MYLLTTCWSLEVSGDGNSENKSVEHLNRVKQGNTDAVEKTSRLGNREGRSY
jgi:hypothetical protein